MLFELNGIKRKTVGTTDPVIVSGVIKGLAFSNFNVLVQNNIINLKDLLLSNPAILAGPVKQIFYSNGQGADYETLLTILAQ